MAQAFNLTAQLNLRGPSNVRTIVADIRRQLGTITANVNLTIDPNANRNIAQLSRTLQTFNTALRTTQTAANEAANAIGNLSRAINAGSLQNVPRTIANVGTATQRLGQNASNTAQQVRQARTEMEEFGRQSALAARRFAAITTVTGSIYALTNAIRQGLSEFIAFDKEMVKLQQVTGESANGLRGLSNTITSLSVNLGVSSSDLVQVSSTLAQAGLSARDTERALKALALSALAPSFDDMNSTVEGSIALMRQFGIGAKDLESALGSVNAVSAQFAVEAGDIIAAIQRTGGVFAAASRGVSEGKDALNEFISVFTSVRATTRESAETIATGLRTIFTRIQRGDTIEALKQFGVTLTDTEGKFVGAYRAVELLSRGLNQIDPRDLRFSQIVEELGGFRQIGKVIPLIQQFSTAQQALKVAQEGQGSLASDAAKAQLSLANQMSKVREEFLALIRDIGGSDTFQNLASGALSLASGLIQVADSVKGVLPALAALMAIRGTSAALQFGAGFVGGIRRSGNTGGAGARGARRFASGGYVPGSGNRDTVPAMLTPGEFVIRKKAVEKIGVGNLSKMNSGRKKFASGGIVSLSNDSSIRSSVRESDFTFQKKAGDQFRATGKNPNKFNPEDKYKINIQRVPVIVTDQDIGKTVKDRYNKSATKAQNMDLSPKQRQKAAQSRGYSFEQVLRQKYGVTLEKNKFSRLDGVDKSGQVFEARSRLEPTSDDTIATKVVAGALSGRSRSESIVQNKLKQKQLRDATDVIDFGNVTVFEDETNGLNKKTQQRFFGGQIQRFMAGQAVKPAKAPVLSPQNLLIGPGYLQKGEWSSTLKSLISRNGLVSDIDSRNLIIDDQKIALSDAFSARQLASARLQRQIGSENITKLEKLRADVASAYSGKRAGVVEDNRPRTENEVKAAQKNNLLFGAAGMYGRRFPASKIILGEADGLKSQTEVAVFGALLDKNAAEKEARLKKRNIMLQGAGIKAGEDIETNAIKSAPTSEGLSNFFGYKASVTGVSRANKQLAMDTVTNIAQSLSPGNGGSQIFLDFDRTLAFGSDKIGPKINKKAPDYSAFGDTKQVAAGLGKAKLSNLGLRLRSLVSELDMKSPELGKELLRRMFVVSARPAKTMPLIARWIRNQGLRIPPGNVSGVGGTSIGPNGVAIAKAEKIVKMARPGSVFIDDDPKNIQAARDQNINSIQYGSAITKKAKIQAAQQEGLQFEKFISDQLPAGLKTGIFGPDGEGIDFPVGLGQKMADYWFKDSRLANVPVDTKRTLTSPKGKIKKNIISHLKAKGYSGGGDVEDYYGKTEVEAARKAWSQFKGSVKKAWSAENTYFEADSPKSIGKGTEAEIYGTGVGKLAKGEPGIVGSKKIKLAKEKAIKSSDPREAAKRKAVRKQDQLAAMALKGILGSLPLDKQKELAGLFGVRPGAGPGLMPSMGTGGADVSKELAEAKQQVSAFKKTGTLNVSKRFLDFFRSSIASYYSELKRASISDPSDDDLKKQLKRTRRAGVDIRKSLRTNEPVGVQGRRTAAGETMNLMLKERFQGFAGGGKISRKVPYEKGVGPSPFDKPKTGIDYYSLEKNSGFGPREFEGLAYFAKTNSFSLDEFRSYISKKAIEKKSRLGARTNIEDLKKQLIGGVSAPTPKQTALAQSLQGEPDAGYRPMRRFAKGGSAQDTVPALLTPGEFVINKKAAKRIGAPRLHQLNRADRIQGYNSGGIVQRFASGSTVNVPQTLNDLGANAKSLGVTLKELLAGLRAARDAAYKDARDSGKSKAQATKAADKNTADVYNDMAKSKGITSSLSSSSVSTLNKKGYLQDFQRTAPKGVNAKQINSVGKSITEFGKLENILVKAANASVLAKNALENENKAKAAKVRESAIATAKASGATDDDARVAGDRAYSAERRDQKSTYASDIKARTQAYTQKGDSILNARGIDTMDSTGKRLSKKEINENTQRYLNRTKETTSVQKSALVNQRFEQLKKEQPGKLTSLKNQVLGSGPTRRTDASLMGQATKEVEKVLALEIKRGAEVQKQLTEERQKTLETTKQKNNSKGGGPGGSGPVPPGGGRAGRGTSGSVPPGGGPPGSVPPGGGPPDKGLGTGSASTRARVRALRSQGVRGQDLRDRMSGGGVGDRIRNGAFAASFAIPMIADQFQTQDPKTAEQAGSNAAIGGIGSAIGSAGMLASMGGKFLGPIAGVAALAGGLGKAFIDAKNAAMEFSKNKAKQKMEESSEKVASILEEISKKGGATPEALDKLNRELKTTIISANEAGSMTRKSSMVQDFGMSGMLSGALGLFGVDSAAEGSTDRGSKQGEINRSMILEQRGLFAYLKSTKDKNFELNTMSELAPQLAKESSKTFSVAADAVNSVLKKKFETGASLSDILKNPAWADQANVIARSNAEINRQIMLIETDTRLSEDEIKVRRNAVVAAYAESKAREQFKLVELEKNMRQLEDSVKAATFSFSRMLQNMDASVMATADNLKLMNDQLDLVSASLSGQAKIGRASGIEKSINVLKNPKGYGSQERKAATSMGSSLFGGQGSNVQKIITASSQIEDKILAAINESGANKDKKLTNEAVGAKLENSVRSKLTQIGLPPELADKLGKQIKDKIGELRKDGEDKIDFNELVEKIPGLSGSIDILNKTNSGVISALEGLRNTFNLYSEASDKIVELQLSINDKMRSAQTILAKGSQTLAGALGKRVPMNQQLEAANQPIRSMTGGTTDPTQIRANINRLENTRGQLEAGRVQSENKTDFQGVQDFNQKLIRNNTALRENYQALEALANSGEKASIALDEINRIQQKQQAGTGIVERLATSSPSELNSLQGAMFRLERNMRGQANLGSSSDMRKESLDLFNQIAPLLGDRQGGLKANVLESQLAEAGVQETPFIRSVLEALRNPESDPEMKAATDAYRAATIEQSRANVQLAMLNNTLATNIATQTADAIKKAITDTRVKFDDQQLSDLLNNINNVPQGKPAAGLASGGVVYKAGGGEMFVPRGTDTVPAMLTPGEFVVNKAATNRNLPLLKSINKGTSYYATGGLVTNFMDDSAVANDLKQANVTDKTYKIISSEAYGPKNPGSYIAGYRASILPSRSSPKNPVQELIEQYIIGKNVGTDEEKVDKLAGKTLDLKPEKTELGVGPGIISSPGTAGGWFNSGEFRPVWSKEASPAPGDAPISLTGKDPIILPTDYINIPNKSLWASERPLFEKLKQTVDRTNYDDKNPFHSSISAQEAIANHIKSSLEMINIENLSDKIVSSRSIKYPNKDWFSTKLVKASSETLNVDPPAYQTTQMMPDKYMNTQVVPVGGSPIPLTSKKSSSPILTSVMGNYGSLFGLTKKRGDIGYDNDQIYGETTETSSLLSKEKLNQFAKNKEIYIQEIDDYLKQLKDADNGKFVNSGATRDAWSGTTLLEQIANDNLSGLYVTLPSDRFKEDWKNKGKSINIFRKSLLVSWASRLKDLKDTTSAKIYGVNDSSKLEINGSQFPWVGSTEDPDLLSNIVGRFTQQQLEAKEKFVSEFNIGAPTPEKDVSSNTNGIKYGFSYSPLTIPRLTPDNGFNKPVDPRNVLQGIMLNPSNEPAPDMLNPFIEETPDKVSRRFVAGADAVGKIKSEMRKSIQTAKDATDKNIPIGPASIPSLLKLLPVPKTQNSSWIGDDFDKAFYSSGPAAPINLYDQVIKLKERIQQQQLEEAAAGGETAKVAGADISESMGKAITKDSVPLSQQILSGVLGPKGNILSTYGHRLFPIKVFQDVTNMEDYLGGVSKVFGRQIVKPLKKKIDPRLPPQQQELKVEPKLAEAWGAVEVSKELFGDIAKQSYLKLGNFIDFQTGVPKINVAKLQEYAIRKGNQGAAYLNVQGVMDTAFNDQNQKQVSKIVDPKRGAIEQAVVDSKTGSLSYKQADVPTNLIELGNLALGPYNMMPSTKRSALLNKLKEELQKVKAEVLLAEVSKMQQWYEFQDNFIDSGLTSVDQFTNKSSTKKYANVLNDYQKYANSLELLTPNSLGLLPDKQKLEEMAAFRSQKQKAAEPQKAARGGIIYAQKGTLVNYEPKGTDTVPAMLTPGEFVVNRTATQKNLPLLKSINSGQYSKGGKIDYLSSGGIIIPKYYADPAGSVEGPNGVVGVSNLQMSLDSTSLDGLKTFNTDFGTHIGSLTAFGTAFGQNISAISTLTTQLATVASVLYKLSIPEQINISAQHKVEVVINGAQAFNNMQEGVQNLVVSSVNTAISKLNVSTDNAFGEGSNKILGKMA